MVEIDPTTLGLEFAGSALLGGIIGYGTKRIAKLLAIIIGVQLVVFRYLQSQEIIIVDWDALTRGVIATSEQAEQGRTYLESLASTVTVGAGFTTGFLIGYHRG